MVALVKGLAVGEDRMLAAHPSRSDYVEGLRNRFHDYGGVTWSNVRNIPDLNSLANRVDPTFAELVVFTFHENQ
jgi:hypothetical protein